MNATALRALVTAGALILSLQQAAAGVSGFIDDMPELHPDADRAGAMTWLKPDMDRSGYRLVAIEPITIFISPDSEYQGLSADDLKTLSDTFRDTVTRTLEPELPTVSRGGAGVLHLRAALTNVKVTKKKRGLLGYMPIGFVASTVKEAVTGPGVSLENAVLEVELLDSVSGERVGILIDQAPQQAGEGEDWEAIAATLRFYAERFKARMLAAQ